MIIIKIKVAIELRIILSIVPKKCVNENDSKKNKTKWCANTIKSVYFTNHTISLTASDGLIDFSILSRADMFDRIVGRINAKNNAADECIPRVLENASTVKPVKKPNSNNAQPGISKGRTRMNKM